MVDIKEIIKQHCDCDGKMYTEEEILNIIQNISLSLDEEQMCIKEIIARYIYKKDNLFFFNLKRKHTAIRQYHGKFIDFNDGSHINNITNVDMSSVRTKKTSPKQRCVDEQNKVSPILEAKLKQARMDNKPGIETDNKLQKYKYPDSVIVGKNNLGIEYEPFGTQWIHDIQYDDKIGDIEKKLGQQFDKLRAIVLPKQKEEAWYRMRSEKITASDGAVALGLNPYEAQYKFILKKTTNVDFEYNKFCYHGNKYEDVAAMIYGYRMNVSLDEFGLMGHAQYDFLGASPDSICNHYKFDGVHLSRFIGRMLEIKCPLVRNIVCEGEIVDGICPLYYWIQVQLQLECCDLNECDFWQCSIKEYNNRDEFIEDTDLVEHFRSRQTGLEKGCVVQLLPKRRMNEILNGGYDKVVYSDAKILYPPRIEMSPYDCDIWLAGIIASLNQNIELQDYYFDRVFYWKLVKSKNITIDRDRAWFAEHFPKLKEIWDIILFFRKNAKMLKIFLDYIESRSIKRNKDIMKVARDLYDVTKSDYNIIVDKITKDIEEANCNKKAAKKVSAVSMFIDDPDDLPS